MSGFVGLALYAIPDIAREAVLLGFVDGAGADRVTEPGLGFVLYATRFADGGIAPRPCGAREAGVPLVLRTSNVRGLTGDALELLRIQRSRTHVLLPKVFSLSGSHWPRGSLSAGWKVAPV